MDNTVPESSYFWVIDDALAKIKTIITGIEKGVALQQPIGVLSSNIEFTPSTNKLAKRKSGIKGVLTGNGRFDKASVEYESVISKALDALSPYLDTEKTKRLISLFGAKDSMHLLEVQLVKLGAEARYLHNQFTGIISFIDSSVDKYNISDLENKLKCMKIDLRACDSYFTADLTKVVMGQINTEIDNLLEKVPTLKGRN